MVRLWRFDGGDFVFFGGLKRDISRSRETEMFGRMSYSWDLCLSLTCDPQALMIFEEQNLSAGKFWSTIGR